MSTVLFRVSISLSISTRRASSARIFSCNFSTSCCRHISHAYRVQRRCIHIVILCFFQTLTLNIDRLSRYAHRKHRMTPLLVLEKIVFSRKSLCVTLAGSDWAAIDFRAVYFTLYGGLGLPCHQIEDACILKQNRYKVCCACLDASCEV